MKPIRSLFAPYRGEKGENAKAQANAPSDKAGTDLLSECTFARVIST